MTEKPYDDSNWREEYRGYTSSRYELDLLENGPKSLAQSWMMGALHNKWKKMKGYKDPEPPDCQSSLQEFEEKAKAIERLHDDMRQIEEKKNKQQIYDDFSDPYGGH